MAGARQAISRARVFLDRDLFPEAPARAAAAGRWEIALAWTAVIVLASVAQLFRLGPSTSLNSLWAEDGPIYLQSALGAGFFHAIFLPYAGYLVLVPRLVAELGAAVPLHDAPAAIAIASALIASLSGLVVWYASSAHIRNVYLRGTLVALTILCPVAGLESVVSAAYVPWFMLIAVFWLLFWRPRTTRGALLGGAFVLFTGLSTPGLWFFFVPAALRLLAIRGRRDLILVGSYLAAAAVQIPVLLTHRDTTTTPEWSSHIWGAYVQRVIDGASFGERLGGVAWDHLGWAFLGVLCVALLLALALGMRPARALGRWTAAIAIFTSVLMFVVSAYQRAVGGPMLWPAGSHSGAAGRYTIVPALLLVSAALVLLDQSWQRRGEPRRLPVAAALAVAVLLAGMVISLSVAEVATRGTPRWDDALHSAARACVSENLEAAPVTTSPPPFGLYIDCDRLSGFYRE